MVREYIHINFMRSIISFGYDLERIIDDFIFLCFFVGNDFLPHIPCLSIREGGIDVLLKVYSYCLSFMPDYINNSGTLNFRSLKLFVDEMMHYEEVLVGEMIVKEANSKQREINNKNFQERERNKNKKGESKGNNNVADEAIDLRDPLGSFKSALEKLGREEALDLEDYSVFGHSVYSYKEKYYREKFKITAA
jgi:5'-3' exoribonuclease 2